MKVELTSVWQAITPALEAELVQFWRDHKAIVSEPIAKARAQQVVAIARDDEGTLCGVGTAFLKVIPRLRQPTYYYRQFFAKALRGQHQELAFFQHCKQVLADFNATLKTPESLGVLMEIENTKIADAYNQAIVPGFEAVFIGYSPRGLQLRVSYFEDALLQPPVRLHAAPIAATASGKKLARDSSNSPIPGTKTKSGSITTEKAP